MDCQILSSFLLPGRIVHDDRFLHGISLIVPPPHVLLLPPLVPPALLLQGACHDHVLVAALHQEVDTLAFEGHQHPAGRALLAVLHPNFCTTRPPSTPNTPTTTHYHLHFGLRIALTHFFSRGRRIHHVINYLRDLKLCNLVSLLLITESDQRCE